MGSRITIDEQIGTVNTTLHAGLIVGALKTGYISIASKASLIEFDPDYQAVLDRGSLSGYTLPSGSQQVKQNQFVLDLKSFGIWPLLDLLYVFAGDGDANFSKLNWKAPATFFPTQVGTVNFTSMSGFKASSGGYFNLNWAPATNGVNWTLNAASMGFVGVENVQTQGYDVGAGSANDISYARARDSGDQTSMGVNGGNLFVSGVLNTTPGISHYQRTGAQSLKSYQNGVLTGSASGAGAQSQNLTVYQFFLMEFNNIGNPTGFTVTNKTYSMFFAGASLSGKEASLNTAWSSYVPPVVGGTFDYVFDFNLN